MSLELSEGQILNSLRQLGLSIGIQPTFKQDGHLLTAVYKVNDTRHVSVVCDGQRAKVSVSGPTSTREEIVVESGTWSSIVKAVNDSIKKLR